jgi:predicted nucleic acid-binding protein
MKPKLYLETTIPSYLAGRPSRDLIVAGHQQITHEWWETRRENFGLYASELVLIELRAGDPQIARQRLEFMAGVQLLEISSEILKVADELIVDGPIPRKAVRDATHIATAAVYGCAYLLTWNCRHIANAELLRSLQRVVERHGHQLPTLCTPEQLMGEKSDDLEG